MTRIVALHGFLGQPQDLRALKAAIQVKHPEVDFQTVDLYLSLTATTKKSFQDWAKKFNQIQKSGHVERNILLGYSMGGRLALQAALDKPGLWDEVVLISAHPGLADEESKSYRLQTDTDWAEKFVKLPWHEVVKLWNDQPVFAGSDRPMREDLEKKRKEISQVMVNWSLAKQDFLGESLIGLKPKLHWYAGEKDLKFVQLFQHLKAEGFIEDMHIIKDAGHRVIFDQPQDLANQLVQNLKL